MKRFNRVYVYIFSILLTCSFSWVSALGFSDLSMGRASLVMESSKLCELSDGLEKKQVISTVCYVYPENLKDTSFKYITVHSELTYLNKITNKIMAIAVLESNFRYNSITKQAECLSTSRGNILNDQDCVLSVCSRRANFNTETGCSIAEVKFTNKGKTYENISYRISCDYMGNIMYV